MFDYTIHPGRKNFCCYNLQAFRTEDTLKSHINECLKINGKLIQANIKNMLLAVMVVS